MTKEEALPYVSYSIDDALSARRVASANEIPASARLVGWQCGFEPLFVAVHSYLPGVHLDASEAEEIASDYLAEIEWFAGDPTPADFVL